MHETALERQLRGLLVNQTWTIFTGCTRLVAINVPLNFCENGCMLMLGPGNFGEESRSDRLPIAPSRLVLDRASAIV